ncbi:hypothetical protein J6590_043721 [Homalodisca vitripennis]|nr:hypothetical protein J6590_043721 [Homalodisca vitripennis]
MINPEYPSSANFASDMRRGPRALYWLFGRITKPNFQTLSATRPEQIRCRYVAETSSRVGGQQHNTAEPTVVYDKTLLLTSKQNRNVHQNITEGQSQLSNRTERLMSQVGVRLINRLPEEQNIKTNDAGISAERLPDNTSSKTLSMGKSTVQLTGSNPFRVKYMWGMLWRGGGHQLTPRLQLIITDPPEVKRSPNDAISCLSDPYSWQFVTIKERMVAGLITCFL